MRLTQLDVLEVQFPFRVAFGHAHTSRKSSVNVLVRIQTDQGVVGFGECVPRDYVTGETPSGAASLILERLGPALLGCQIQRFEQAPQLLSDVFSVVDGSEPSGAARCAVELAVLDASGQTFGRSVGELLGRRVRQQVTYSGVLPLLREPLLFLAAIAHRVYGVNVVKLKVGRSLAEDLQNLRILRTVLGPKADLRVDANCAWQPDEAVQAIQAMQRYRIQVVEQPVGKDDFDGLKRVSDAVEVPVMADESLCTVEDARRLADGRMVDMFNIRVSKCGGLLAARQIAEIASTAGLTCQMGAHPGESAILSAAGRQFAATTANLRYFEGSTGTILLKQDIANASVAPGWGGLAPALDGPGLGVRIDEAKLEPFISERHRVR
jgi:L-alanine-DL-glutamate epimerase-like enolase superfamily enzyme